MEVKNIYCVGKNYEKHAKELGSTVPAVPLIFSKPSHSLAPADGRALAMPSDRGAIHYEGEIVIQMARPFEEGVSLEECISGIALGVDFTLRDEQNRLREERHPWLTAKGFPQSAALTEFFGFPGEQSFNNAEFTLVKNGEVVQIGDPKDMVFKLEDIMAFCQKNLGLDAGDIIYTGTPEGVGEVHDGDEIHLTWNGEETGRMTITKSP